MAKKNLPQMVAVEEYLMRAWMNLEGKDPCDQHALVIFIDPMKADLRMLTVHGDVDVAGANITLPLLEKWAAEEALVEVRLAVRVTVYMLDDGTVVYGYAVPVLGQGPLLDAAIETFLNKVRPEAAQALRDGRVPEICS